MATTKALPAGAGTPVERTKNPGSSGILSAALRAFRQVGYGGTSVRDIARGANVTVAALYHHFDSKQTVLFTLMRSAMEQNLEGVTSALAKAGPSPRAQLVDIVAVHVVYHTSHQAEAFVGNSELRSLEPANRAEIVKMRDEVEHIFVQVIEDGVRSGDFATKHPHQAARAILAMSTAVASWYRPNGELKVKDIRDDYVDIALDVVAATERG